MMRQAHYFTIRASQLFETKYLSMYLSLQILMRCFLSTMKLRTSPKKKNSYPIHKTTDGLNFCSTRPGPRLHQATSTANPDFSSLRFAFACHTLYYYQSYLLFYSQYTNDMDITTVPQELDLQMKGLLPKINDHCFYKNEASKHLKIRIAGWLSRLSSIVSNNCWRRNRNNYLRLLYIMLQAREILQPFTNMAPDQVPTLQKHQINCILLKLSTKCKQREREKQNKSSKVDPTSIWQSFQNRNVIYGQSKQPITKDSSNLQTKSKPMLSLNTALLNQKSNSQLVFDFLSPISQGDNYFRANSNLSDCTFHSIKKCRDLLCLNDETEKTVEIKKSIDESSLSSQQNKIRQQITYFRSNRKNIETKGPTQKKEFNQEFCKKVFNFLRRHKQILEQDEQYNEVIKQIDLFLNKPWEESASLKQEKLDSKILKEKISEENFDEESLDESFSNLSKGVSHSTIEADKGISPAHLKSFLQKNDKETTYKNIFLEFPRRENPPAPATATFKKL